MLPREIIKKIKLIDIKTKLLVDEMFSGEYHSVFKGRGIEFSEVREYTYGDDVRTIDWNVTARYGKPFVKVYEEERELTVILLFDVSSSTLFGSADSTKRDMMIELAALFSFSAVENNDRVGAVLFTDRVEKYIPPKKDKTHALRILRELIYYRPRKGNTDLNTVFDFINNTQTRKVIIFILSDFFDEGYEKSFKMMAKRHDVIPVIFIDPLEQNIINHKGLFLLEDIETGAGLLIDTADPFIRSTYKQNLTRNRMMRKKLFTEVGLDFIEVSTDKPYIKPIFEFFQKRARKL
jgi:uncharacterized protein (DUF58 family)